MHGAGERSGDETVHVRTSWGAGAAEEARRAPGAAAPARRRAETGGSCGGVEQAALHPQLSRRLVVHSKRARDAELNTN